MTMLPYCLLCKAARSTSKAGFVQLYAQKDTAPMPVTWWECRACRGWFAYPVPAPEKIQSNWGTVVYNDPEFDEKIAAGKETLQRRMLLELAALSEKGPLLDYGCNFGAFLRMAKLSGWEPEGFDAFDQAVAACRSEGFTTSLGWLIEQAGYPTARFNAVTANDVFYYSWDPHAAMVEFYRILKPGGVLVMRLTNKNHIMRWVRSITSPGTRRDVILTRMLQGQFHSIKIRSLARILEKIGFLVPKIIPRASTAPWKSYSLGGKLAYVGSDLAYWLTLGTINISPGVLLIAVKPKK